MAGRALAGCRGATSPGLRGTACQADSPDIRQMQAADESCVAVGGSRPSAVVPDKDKQAAVPSRGQGQAPRGAARSGWRPLLLGRRCRQACRACRATRLEPSTALLWLHHRLRSRLRGGGHRSGVALVHLAGSELLGSLLASRDAVSLRA